MSQDSLRKKKEFDQVFASGHSFYSPILGIKAHKNKLELNRFGIIISTKISKKAVIRNRLRRQIREILRHSLPKTENNYDLVIIVLDKIIGKEFGEIKEVLLKTYQSLRLK